LKFQENEVSDEVEVEVDDEVDGDDIGCDCVIGAGCWLYAVGVDGIVWV
jgi:hypothetical protein